MFLIVMKREFRFETPLRCDYFKEVTVSGDCLNLKDLVESLNLYLQVEF